jgi:hypothetical protein
MGHDCDFYLVTGGVFEKLYYQYYMSFNFTQFQDKYGWSIDVAHGHATRTIIKQLTQVIQVLENELSLSPYQSCQYPLGTDAWSPAPDVFLGHLRSLYNLCFDINRCYPDETVVMFSDQSYETIPYQTDGYESEGYSL